MSDELEMAVQETPVETLKAKAKKVAADKTAAEAVQDIGDADTDKADGAKSAKCPTHPKVDAVLYGMCTACYDKLKPVQKRKLYLEARLAGVNTHNYPATAIRAWKQELVFISTGVWKGPMKMNSKSKLIGDIIG